MRHYKNRIVVLGGGESGVGAAILAKKKGFDVFLSDNSVIEAKYKSELETNEIAYEENGHSEFVLSASEIIKSPGIPSSSPLVLAAFRKGISIISEIEFASRYTFATKICITGSNGKTTTSSLIYHILKSAGLHVGLAGNIGKSFARQVAQDNYDYYVLELSSFQLDDMYNFKAEIAILLNIQPDHLDRYGYDFQKYIESKMRITRNQTQDDAFIYWGNDINICNELQNQNIVAQKYLFSEYEQADVSAYTKDSQIIIKTHKSVFKMEQDLLALTGTHNLYNSLAAGITAKLLDISDSNLRQSLSDFKGVEHRLEKIADVKGIHFINDSKATNVNSCWYALKSIKSKVILILGGIDKGNDYTEIEQLVMQKVQALIFLGKDNSKLHQFFDGKVAMIEDASSMEQAVKKAYDIASNGSTVLLSPCCASFDLFKNYEDRGEQFKYWVRKL